MIENNAVTTQQLSGNVVVKVKQGNTIIKKIKTHNTGTLDLMYGMLLSLSGNIDNDCRPRYAAVGTGHYGGSNPAQLKGLVTDVTSTRSIITQNYKGAPKENLNNDTVTVVCQAIIQYKNLSAYQGLKEIGLFGTSNTASLVARIELPDADVINLDVGQSIIIEWTFALQNISA